MCAPAHDFKLCLLGGDVAGQLQALARARALPAFGAHHFGMAAALARGGSRSGGGGGSGRGLGTGPAPLPPSSPEVCRAAEAARLHRLTQDTPLDYAAAAAVSSCQVSLGVLVMGCQSGSAAAGSHGCGGHHTTITTSHSSAHTHTHTAGPASPGGAEPRG